MIVFVVLFLIDIYLCKAEQQGMEFLEKEEEKDEQYIGEFIRKYKKIKGVC